MAMLAQETGNIDTLQRRVQLSSRLLLIAPFLFVVAIIFAVAGGMAGAGPTFTSREAARDYIMPFAATWAAVWVITTLPYVLLTVAVAQLRGVPQQARVRILLALGLISAAVATALRLLLCYLNIGLLVDAPLVASQPFNPVGVPIGWSGLQPVADLLMLIAMAILALGLFISRLLRRTGLIVVILCGVILFIHGLTMLTSSFTNALPPIVPTLLGLPLGIGLIRRRDA